MNTIPESLKEAFARQPGPGADEMYELCMASFHTHPQEKEYLQCFAGYYLDKSGHADEAISYLRKCLPGLTVQECIDDAYLSIQHAYYNTGRIAEAIKVMEETLAFKDGFATHIYEEIIEYAKQINDWDNILRYGHLYEQECDFDGDVFEAMAQAYDAKRDYLKSAKYYDLAGQHTNNEDQYYLFCQAGRAYALAGDEEEAMFYFKMSTKLNPRDYASSYYYIGQCYQNKNDVYRAMQNYVQALKIDPNYPEVYNNLAALSFDEDSNIEVAIINAEKALEMNPDKNTLTTLYINLIRLNNMIADYDKKAYYEEKLFETLGFPPGFGENIDFDMEGDEE